MKRYLAVCRVVLLLSLGLLAAVYPELPALVPVHWNAAGEVDAWEPRTALFLNPAITVGIAVLWLVLPKVSPQRFAVAGFAHTWWFCGMAVIALLGYLQCVHLWGALEGMSRWTVR